jgi:hypothetical protein
LGGEYLKGHPDEPDVIALREALENVLVNTAVETALAVIKRAVSEKSWFMIVLGEHQTPNDSVEFEKAKELCESLAASLSIKELVWHGCRICRRVNGPRSHTCGGCSARWAG